MKTIEQWMNENHFGYIDLAIDARFSCNVSTKMIFYSLNNDTPDVDKEFLRFLYENCDYNGPAFFGPALAFLHEIGHILTNNICTNEDWNDYYKERKQLYLWDNYEFSYWYGYFANKEEYYWTLKPELLANIFVANYCRTYPNRVKELSDIFEREVANYDNV